MIKSTINAQIAQALKEKDEIRLSTLRMLSSALNYEFIAKQHELSDEEEIVVVKKEAKKRKDAIEVLKEVEGKKTESKISVAERIKKEEEELNILHEFLPEEVEDSLLEKWIDQVIKETQAKQISDMGKVIGMVIAKAKGNADGAKVAKLVKEKLTS